MDCRAVAAYCRLSLATVYSYRTRGTLPDPDVMIGGNPAWYRRTIEEWKRSRPWRPTQ